MNEDEKQELINYIKSVAGACPQIPIEKSEDMKEVELNKGELLYLDDQLEIKIGNGQDPVRHLKGVRLGGALPYYNDDLPAVVATKMWKELQLGAKPLRKITKILPPTLRDEFIAQKPDNFSFCLGESIPIKSPLKQFKDVVVNWAGTFFRIFDNRTQGAITPRRDSYERQNHALQQHRHTSYNYYDAGWSEYGWFSGGSDFYHTNHPPWIRITGVIEANVASETRPVNFSALVLIRLY